MKQRGSRCEACVKRFGDPVRLSMHCDETGHAKPAWLKKLERDLSEPEDALELEAYAGVTWGGALV